MFLDFSWLPPEINSARIFSGAGSGPLHVAANAWEGLAADLAASASSFDSVIVGLASGPWAGPASASMAAAATPYVGWLSAAAAQAQMAAGQARAAATAFETALTATVHPAAVSANRVSLATLIATNFFGFNTPAIASTEFDYVEMWAQDVAAMVGYHGGATAVAESLTPFSVPPVDLLGLASQVGANLAGVATTASSAVSPVAELVAAAPTLVTGVQSLASALPISSVMSLAQVAATPASMLIGPLMQVGQMGGAGTAGLASATEGLGADATKFVGDVAPEAKGLGGLGGGMAGNLGQARLVGAMSVPPTWEGSVPKGMSSAAMHGMGGPTAASMEAAAAAAAPTTGGGMPMMPMPTGMGAGGGGMPAGMGGRGGGSPHVTQNRPSVIPRTGIG